MVFKKIFEINLISLRNKRVCQGICNEPQKLNTKLLGFVMYKKHSIEERLLAVQKCLEGYAPWGVGRILGIKEHYVSEWLDRYRQNGIAGLQKRPNKHADFAEKCKIVCEYAEKSVPLHRDFTIYV